MAIYGSLGEVNVGALSATINDNAVDVFVYDTRKDSDSGQWRKRTQHTSWYNETLNTATRGSRRDFPAVAVIVASTSPNRVTIYDADDPDMPMWMVFTANVNQFGAIFNNRSVVSILAANGSIIWADSLDSVVDVSFIKDNYTSTAASGSWDSLRNIIDRNPTDTNNLWTRYNPTRAVVSYPLNDLAITVLPNAPIDSATGLPIPTIAVATKGGISIITDSGTVYNLTPESDPAYSSIKNFFSVGFDSNCKIFFTDSQTGSGYSQLIYLPNYNYNQSLSDTYSSLSGSYNYVWGGEIRSTSTQVGTWNINDPSRLITKSVGTRDSIAIGYTSSSGRNGMSLIGQQDNYLMNCGITTSYNTGWMYGYTQGAWLSDTSTASVSGTELVTNGTFDTNTSGWSLNGGTLSVVSQRAQYVTTSNTNIYRAITCVVGKTYNFSYTHYSGYTSAYISTNENASNAILSLGDAIGSSTIYRYGSFVATQTTYYVVVYGIGNTTSTFDDISVRLAEPDRSVNNKGLAVFGTISKSAVATGSNLVSYGGWSSSNYLLQPNAIPPGTGNFSLCFWIKPGSLNSGSGGYFHLFSMGTSTTTGQASATGFVFKMATTTAASSSGYIPYFYNGTGTDFNLYDANNYFPLGTWSHCVAGRNGNVFYIYINGRLVKTGSTSTINFTDTYLSIGSPVNTYGNEHGGDAQVSLLRYSTTFPSPDQIRKIYEEEKALFQPNSQCTLYGSSDAVTALAYDDTTKLLSVGTSSGRSDFQGLERINNTTTAVTTAISASNGLIAEQ